METTEFVRAVSALLNGDVPLMPTYPVCLECKMKENEVSLLGRVDCPAPGLSRWQVAAPAAPVTT